MSKFVLLDRDGVINQDSHDFIKSPDEWRPLDGSLEAIALLNQHGYQIAVITNQSGLARGLFDEAALTQIHAKMRQLVAGHGGKITAIYYCPHGADSTCGCRKPKPGLLLQCAADYQIKLSETVMIGDSYRDLQAGIAAGAKPVLVKTGNGKQTLTEHPNLNIPVFDNLYDAAKHLVSRQ
ncbi:MAG: D-glycero-beta-D-manno-heptose 1,7-bisphosphate 7-phosphatase [Methylovulum sp.]|uniref:D-glycero-beta-D-manno-heptose 1,7-bisphosphate 7-phosphatase n=1 Tax=Methylovulum sp. TaxID=1916980 RepID=UPI00262BC8F5|nr:D-glycero-beta-D-manno-heptose 1,7-bisphosphate 7-phosphatase [Methylovulum sp.]MDD2723840.1 D-glycero-beta-D-manno-heptose 1,7-bisphosphate 7-phosphatase [Methylovulum sp.]MDD5123718.1 D-glycero-beta-D-manno-heptose 1,7-bisphosphate 7-phosphatase [Methylovulum sp.]